VHRAVSVPPSLRRSAFAAAGADVAISFSASPDKAAEVVRAIQAAGQKEYAIKADHAKQEEVTALIASAQKQLGGLASSSTTPVSSSLVRP
jgi:hypothetical protein